MPGGPSFFATIAVAALIGAPVSGSDAVPPEGFCETRVASVPVGATPATIWNRECAATDRVCIAGFAALRGDDTLYFFDPGRQNVKVIAIGLPRGGLARVISGPTRSGATLEWLDGAVGGDGTVYLLRARSRTDPTVVFAAWHAGARSWIESDPIDVGLLEPDSVSAPRLRAGSTVLAVLPSGEVALCAGRGLLGPALVVAREGRPLVSRIRVRRAPGIDLPGGRQLHLRDGALELGTEPERRFRLEGRLVGTDAAGKTFLSVAQSWSRERLDCYDHDGRLVASTPLSGRPDWKPIFPRGPLLVSREGEVIEVCLSESGLVVWRWTPSTGSALESGDGRD
jgi:hypothetical protein